MLKAYRPLAGVLVMLSSFAPMSAPPAMATGPGIPNCPPPPTQKVATLTYNIHVTGTHETQWSMGQATETANMQRDREFKGVVRMVYYEDTDFDALARQSGPATTRTPDIPDRMGPGKVGVIDSQGPMAPNASMRPGAMSNELQARMLACQSKGGPNVIACQMAVAQAMANKGKKTCDLTKERDKNDPLCIGLNGGGLGKLPQPPSTPGQCIPGQKGVKTGLYEVWVARGCKVQAYVRDHGELMLQADRSTRLVPTNKLEAGEGSTQGEFGCDAMLIISKMTNTASLMVERHPTSIMVTDVTGGHSGKITDYGDGDKMKQTFAALKSTGAVFNTGARDPMNWSTLDWTKNRVIIPNAARVGSRTNFMGEWAKAGFNPRGMADYNYGAGPSRPHIRTRRAESMTQIKWRFDADPKPHVVK